MLYPEKDRRKRNWEPIHDEKVKRDDVLLEARLHWELIQFMQETK